MVWKNLKRNARKVANATVNAVGASGKSFVKTRYGGGAPGLANLARDVMMLKSLLNVEKKRIIQNSSGAQLLAQVSANTSGHYIYDITPVPTQSNNVTGRSGSSVKWTSSHMKLQIFGQTALVNKIRYKIYIIENKGVPLSITNGQGQTVGVADFFSPNAWIENSNAISIYDYNSVPNNDKQNNFRVLRLIKGSISGDTISSQTNQKDVTIGLKFKNRHVRFDGNSNTITRGQVFMVLMTDLGNSHASTVCTLSQVTSTAVGTGLGFYYSMTHYYVDN